MSKMSSFKSWRKTMVVAYADVNLLWKKNIIFVAKK
jgi:hypothetical protein